MLQQLSIKNFNEMFALMESSFPSDERREKQQQKDLFSIPEFTAYGFIEESKLIAFITLWNFKDFTYIEHFAVDSTMRSRGLGGKILNEVLSMHEKPVCLEAELPETEIARRRIEFYRRNGFFTNDFPYFQPPYSKGKNPVELKIMTSQRSITMQEFELLKSILYQNVYQKQKI